MVSHSGPRSCGEGRNLEKTVGLQCENDTAESGDREFLGTTWKVFPRVRFDEDDICHSGWEGGFGGAWEVGFSELPGGTGP